MLTNYSWERRLQCLLSLGLGNPVSIREPAWSACQQGSLAGSIALPARSLHTPKRSSFMLQSLDLASAGHRFCVDFFFFLFLIEGQGRMGRECSSVNYINEDLVLFLIP